MIFLDRNITLRSLIFILLITRASVSLAQVQYECPVKVFVRSSIVEAPKEWEIKNNRDYHYFTAIAFTDGHPSKLAFLKPSNLIDAKSKNGFGIEIYNFAHLVNKQAWLVCQYANTPATVIKALPQKHTSCNVKLTKEPSDQTINCKN